MTAPLTLADIESAADIVYRDMRPTPQYAWPMLCERLGAEVWLKHENHTPTGAFKIRGGLVYFERLARSGTLPKGVISATRGNHGQSVGYAARRHGIAAAICVPHGNSIEKNAAMRALGVELIEHGDDFQASREHAERLARERQLHMVPAFHPWLIAGVATYSLELLRAVKAIDVAYVPIGMGSGICGMVAARDALGLKTEIVGVVSAHATAYFDSFHAKRVMEAPVTTQLADGMACRLPDAAALDMIWRGVDRIVKVGDDDIAHAMRVLFECTHNTCEGAGAAAIAAAMQERTRISGKRIAAVVSGGNVDAPVFASVLRSA